MPGADMSVERRVEKLFVIPRFQGEVSDFGIGMSDRDYVKVYTTLDDAVREARQGDKIYETEGLRLVGKMAFRQE